MLIFTSKTPSHVTLVNAATEEAEKDNSKGKIKLA
ncbi:Uncharacterised protein [Orientia tsutsugamushi]|uniref:Uncharacterized protein n=2 Tax=Orientia tsutsugamushi TaxID=784 RepID=A0A2U3QSS5_ORITS|nr:Uncharacterised protein [Orientia tsutsugamushi]BAG39554.1 hypothetical protein OTT_0096 [Orientia tsutsugamushi str. Ikeda]SPR07068.1 Uncharacterised protein [Orientia tsutsugamushi]SPR07702.1 Uncharacterised protein [Orientia tsutsugamushi]SPR07956.1 Uncharacterised protein [Orientia tsutsugamushi]